MILENLNLGLLYNGQEYLLFIVFIMMAAGLIKEHNLFASTYTYIQKAFKSKRAIVALMSALTGILPVSGRVTISAGMLDTLAPPKGQPGREKFGIIDYLSTHHYYVWSPLEKTIIIPMAALGIGYGAVLLHLLPLLIVSLGLVFWYIAYQVKEEEILLNITNVERFKISNILRNVFPFLAAIGAAIAGVHPTLVFGLLLLYYMILTMSWSIKKLLSYVNWKLIIWVSIIIAIANITGSYADEIETFLKTTAFDINTVSGFLSISGLALASSFLFGSSSRFIAITTILTLIYGVEYFVWFFAIDYVGYLLSPTHKCVVIGKLYFDTPWKRYANALGAWAVLLITAAGLTLLI